MWYSFNACTLLKICIGNLDLVTDSGAPAQLIGVFSAASFSSSVEDPVALQLGVTYYMNKSLFFIHQHHTSVVDYNVNVIKIPHYFINQSSDLITINQISAVAYNFGTSCFKGSGENKYPFSVEVIFTKLASNQFPC